ncbi:BTAD domain-containing putative transcriptional regulator [Actinosynnema sp. NPDC020468]|uniref:AfsR/SARP family transcriptional regulator n=1 Tax=Actinosynnema sp. NPDC020468 TaxID=3154488 RepID=UPI0033F74210
MGLRVLGPPELVVRERSIGLGGLRQRTMLSLLALNANRVTPLERLVDAVWNGNPPSTARGQVQICVSRLRRLFRDSGCPAAIHTRAPGYQLEIAPAALDSVEFLRLTALAREHTETGRFEEAAVALREGLALWRGAALAGVDSPLVQRSAAVLEQHRQAAMEERIRLDLVLGRHEEVAAELPVLVDADPLRERLYELLMLALYRCGRQAEALEVARRARDRLVRDLGIEPGPGLRDLEASILRHDRDLDPGPRRAGQNTVVRSPEPHPEAIAEPPPTVPRQLPGSIVDFTGRESHLEQIRRQFARQESPYALRVVAITGAGGVGKSTLAVRVAHEVQDLFPDGQIFADLGPNGDGDPNAALARFLRALGLDAAGIPREPAERAELYRTRLAGRRVLVVLDGAASEEQVRPLLPGSATCAVIVTSRARLGLPGAHGVEVRAFDECQATRLLTRIVGGDRVAAEPAATAALARLCGGLPLALRIAGARLAAKPHWRVEALVDRLGDEAGRLDELSYRGVGIRSTIALTAGGLDDRERRLFALCALVGTADFAAWTAAALLDTDRADAEDAVERLVDAHLLDIVPGAGGPPRYRFHDLVRGYALEQSAVVCGAGDRAAALRRLLGGWLRLAQRAHRAHRGGDVGVPRGSASGWEPEDGFAVDGATRWWEVERRSLARAVRQAAEAGWDDLCRDLAAAAVGLAELTGDAADWRDTAGLGLAAARRAGDDRGEAAMLHSLGSLHVARRRWDEAEEAFEAALAIFRAVEDVHGCALVLRNWACVDAARGRHAALRRKHEEALVGVRAVGDVVGEADILRGAAESLLETGEDVDAARLLLDRALLLCREVGYRRGEALVLHRFVRLHLASGRLDLARRAVDGVLEVVRDLGDRTGESHALLALGTVHRAEGRLAEAETVLCVALDLARDVADRVVEGRVQRVLSDVRALAGQVDAARDGPAEGYRTLIGAEGAAVGRMRVRLDRPGAVAVAGTTRFPLGRGVPGLRPVVDRPG